MNVLFWGLTLGFVGKCLLGVSVVLVHAKVVHEHGIDQAVLTEMKQERNTAILGIVFMAVGYMLELMHFGFITNIFVNAAAI